MDITTKDLISKKIAALHQKRQNIIQMPGEKGMEEILNADAPAALVHAFPAEDFYFFIQEIGPDDTLEILSLASDKQWEYLLDVDIWEKDQVDLKELTLWFRRFLAADSKRFIRMCYGEKKELVKLYLYRNLDILIREPDQDPSEFPIDYIADDDTYYIKILSPSEINDELQDFLDIRRDFLLSFLNRLSTYDHIQYQGLLHEAKEVLPAEVEEERYRLRTVRLAESGFLPFDEAIGAYQPLSAQEVLRKTAKVQPKSSSENEFALVPHYLSNLLDSDNVFAVILSQIENSDLLLHLQTEFVNLCNQIIIADGVVRKEREALQVIVKKTTGFINIGIEKIIKENHSGKNPTLIIETYFLSDIFRVGYGAALSLKWKAQHLKKSGWFNQTGLPLNFWGENWLGVLGGLLIKKPLYFSNYQDGKLYKEFETLKEIHITEKVIGDIKQVDDLLGEMNPVLDSFVHYRFLNYKNLTLTLWVNHYLNEESSPKKLAPIAPEAFQLFFEKLWASSRTSRKISDEMKENFLNFISQITSKDVKTLSDKTAHIWETLFDEVENEYKHISPSNLNPKYIHHFIIRNQT